MKDFSILYVPIGVGTFHMPTAAQKFEDSCALLVRLANEAGLDEQSLILPDGILFSSDDVAAYVKDADPSLVILQNVTFANAAYTARLCEAINAPVIVWTLRDPAADGGRLKQNALTGAFAAAHTLYMNGQIQYRHLLGDPSEEAVQKTLGAYMRAFMCLEKIQGKTMLCTGEPPEGFSFGSADPHELKEKFGLSLVSVSMDEVFRRARSAAAEETAPYLADAREHLAGFSDLPAENQNGYAALMKAYRDLIAEYDAAAVASRCWPDCFTEYGTPVCAVLSVLGDLGVPASCEGDAYGALTMLLGYELAGRAVFFGDPAALSEEENTITFWHCGMAAPSLACEEDGPAVGTHCNRGIGPTMEFGCRGSERATILRIGRDKDGMLRLFLCGGEAITLPRQYHGTSLVVRPDRPAGELIRWAVEDGWEPHFIVVPADIEEAVQALAALCGIGIWKY